MAEQDAAYDDVTERLIAGDSISAADDFEEHDQFNGRGLFSEEAAGGWRSTVAMKSRKKSHPSGSSFSASCSGLPCR
jgi:hypothetical protein